MTSEHKERVEALFEAALEQPAEDRAAWLQDACGTDASLHAEVCQLLEAHERAGGILEIPPAGIAALLQPIAEPPAAPQRVGPYRVVREIGRGGMGIVYLAERDDEQFRQSVAIKLIHRGADTTELVQRFLAERQILASLQHPHIARLLDGGLSGDARPYLVMEYVDGQPLDVYCDQRRLSIHDRLELFAVVARAVHYAHRNLVVHRDIKPSNILVTEEGEPKLLDFGIAKLLDPAIASHTVPLTRTGLRLMTPEYASPEQVRGEAVTTATDVYGLGLVLYELLSGHRPFDVHGSSAAEVERIICHRDPARLSAAVMRSDTASMPDAISRARGTEPRRLCRMLGGDLDRIVLTAIRKEPERRYPSAAALQDDIEHYLQGRPITARGDTPLYRLGKFTRRHRWGVAAAAGFVLLLAGYAATVTVKERELRFALDQAYLEAEKSEQVTTFLMRLFESADPGDAVGNAVTARDLLDRGVSQAEQMDRQPEAQAQMLDVLGRVYLYLGEYARAQPLLERSLDQRRRLFGTGHLSVAESLHDLATLHHARGQFDEAEPLFRQALDIQRGLLGAEHRQVARTLTGLATLLRDRGDYAAAEDLTREALAMRRKLLGPEHPDVAESLTELAYLLHLNGDYAAAELRYQEALEISRRLYPEEHPSTAATMSSLALFLTQRGDVVAAESLHREVLAMRRSLLGNEHPDVALSLGLLASVLRRKGDYAAAEPLYRESLVMSRRLLGPEHPNTAHTMNGLALLLQERGDLDAAEALFREVLDIRRRRLGDEHPSIANSLSALGALMRDKGDYVEAESLLNQSLAMRRGLLGDDHPSVAGLIEELVALYEAWDRPAQADSLRQLLTERPVAGRE